MLQSVREAGGGAPPGGQQEEAGGAEDGAGDAAAAVDALSLGRGPEAAHPPGPGVNRTNTSLFSASNAFVPFTELLWGIGACEMPSKKSNVFLFRSNAPGKINWALSIGIQNGYVFDLCCEWDGGGGGRVCVFFKP